MSVETYKALAEALQAHIADESADPTAFAAHWGVVVGVDSLNGYDEQTSQLHIFKSPRTPSYVLTGMLEYAANAYYNLGEAE